MRKMFDYSNPTVRRQFAARFDALPDPMAKIGELTADVDRLEKMVGQQRAQLTGLLAQLGDRDPSVARRYGEALVKIAGQRAATEQRVAQGLLRKAQGPQPPLVVAQAMTPARREAATRAFLTHFLSH